MPITPVKAPISYFKGMQTVRLNYKSPVENLYDTPVDLPTAEPDTPQFSKMLTQDDFPNIILQSSQPFSCVYVATVILAGKNTAGSSLTVYYKVYNNGSLVASGSKSVSANYYWTLQTYCVVSVGDVLEVKAWASGSGVNYDYDAYQVQVSRLVTAEALDSPCTIYFSSVVTQPALVKGSPYVISYNSYFVCHLDRFFWSTSSTVAYDVVCPKTTYGLFRIDGGDYSYMNSGTVLVSSSYRPYYYRNYVPNTIRLYIWGWK